MTGNPLSSRRARLGASLVAVAAVAASALIALPAHAATLNTFRTALHVGTSIGIQDAKYAFQGDHAAGISGPASGSGTITWGATSPSSTSDLHAYMTGRIVEYGTATPYWIGIDSTLMFRDNGTIDQAVCTIYNGDPNAGGAPLDQSSQTPYQCPTVGPQYTGNGPNYTIDASLDTLTWANVQGVIAPSGTVSLDQGDIESDTTDFTVGGVPLARATGYTTIPSGKTVTWSASERNGENLVTPAGRFSYRILDGGVPSGFWVEGYASNERGVEFYHTATCDIYQGDPLEGGAIATSTPYTCSMSNANLNGRGFWQVTFAVGRHSVTDVQPLEAQGMLTQACGGTGGACIYVPTSTRTVLQKPGVLIGQPYANNTADDVQYSFKYASARTTTNSINVTAKAGIDFFDVFSASVSFAYGWSQSNETEKIWDADMRIRPGCVGHFELTPSYDVFTGDYLFALNGQWYRAKDVSWTVPNPKTPGTLDAITKPIAGSGMSQAQCGTPIAVANGAPNGH